jgi:hypothetical protein
MQVFLLWHAQRALKTTIIKKASYEILNYKLFSTSSVPSVLRINFFSGSLPDAFD